MIIIGKNAVAEAINSGKTIDRIMVSKSNYDNATNEIVRAARERGIKISFVDKYLLDKSVPGGKHQGVICYATDFEYCEPADILSIAEQKNEAPFILLLDGISDPHNLGAIIRSAECAGVHGIVIPKNRAVSVNDTVIKVSEGASMHVPVARVTNINDTIVWLQDRFVTVLCADMDGDPMYDKDLTVPLALVIGGEGSGVKRLTKERSDGSISIPLLGKINSLNASNAAAIVAYEVVRQRRFAK